MSTAFSGKAGAALGARARRRIRGGAALEPQAVEGPEGRGAWMDGATRAGGRAPLDDPHAR